MKSPEQEIKDEIRTEYAQTYPNVIFALTNSLERNKRDYKDLKKVFVKYITYSHMHYLEEFTDEEMGIIRQIGGGWILKDR